VFGEAQEDLAAHFEGEFFGCSPSRFDAGRRAVAGDKDEAGSVSPARSSE
jgi:hypothetical protein